MLPKSSKKISVTVYQFDIPLTIVHCFDNAYGEKQPLALKEYCAEYWLKELQGNMDMCTGCRDITEIVLKTV